MTILETGTNVRTEARRALWNDPTRAEQLRAWADRLIEALVNFEDGHDKTIH